LCEELYVKILDTILQTKEYFMQYILESSKTIEEIVKNLQVNISANGFGILHIHNLEETMHNKGVELGEACQIFEICNPHQHRPILRNNYNYDR